MEGEGGCWNVSGAGVLLVTIAIVDIWPASVGKAVVVAAGPRSDDVAAVTVVVTVVVVVAATVVVAVVVVVVATVGATSQLLPV